MAPKTTKRKLPKSDLKIAKEKLAELNATPLSKYKVSPEIEKYYSEAWEKRFTELEQEVRRKADVKTMDMIVNADIDPKVSIGADHYRIFNPDPKHTIVSKGTVHELAADVNINANEVKQLVITIKNKLVNKLGPLTIPETNSEDKRPYDDVIPPIEAELLATKSELAQIYSLLTQINDLQEVKL